MLQKPTNLYSITYKEIKFIDIIIIILLSLTVIFSFWILIDKIQYPFQKKENDIITVNNPKNTIDIKNPSQVFVSSDLLKDYQIKISEDQKSLIIYNGNHKLGVISYITNNIKEGSLSDLINRDQNMLDYQYYNHK